MSVNDRSIPRCDVMVYLENEEAEKVEVGESLELLEEIQRQKRDERVFRGLNLVVLKDREGISKD